VRRCGVEPDDGLVVLGLVLAPTRPRSGDPGHRRHRM